MMRLKNRYYAMRHGRSLANEQDVIVSHPKNGVLAEYGLSEVGRQQVDAEARNSTLSNETLIYASDFSRARQTAEIVRETIGAVGVISTIALRERYFGDWEKTSTANYEKVWQVDHKHTDWHENNVESLDDVWERVWQLVAEIEQKYQDRDILLVSHGDTLQILQAGLAERSLTQHRDVSQLKTAEIRRLA